MRKHLANQKQPQTRRVPKNARVSDVGSDESTPTTTDTVPALPASLKALRAVAKESPNKASGPGKQHPAPGAAHGPEEPPPNTHYPDAPSPYVRGGMGASIPMSSLKPMPTCSTRHHKPRPVSPNAQRHPTISPEKAVSQDSCNAGQRVQAQLPPRRVPSRRLSEPAVPGPAAVASSGDQNAAAVAVRVAGPEVKTQLSKVAVLEACRQNIKSLLAQHSTTISKQMTQKSSSLTAASRTPRPSIH